MRIEAVSRRVAQKELRLFFASPVAWLFLSVFAATTLFVFFWVEAFFARNIADLRPLFEWMPLLLIFLSAAVTMRMWSEERRSGTLEHVMTQPASLWRFVLGKFLACFGLLLVALTGTLPLPVTVAAIGELDWGPVAAGYVASTLLGAAYLSAGLFVSSRTDNPIVSLIGTVLLCGLLYLSGRVTLTGFFDDNVGDVLRMFSTSARFDSITRGVIDLRDLVYYLSLTIGFLALNTYTLERERWALSARTSRHRRWRGVLILLLLNLLVINIWLYPLKALRMDVTQGRIYSISDATEEVLEQLAEPLLLRGYFSAKSHPLLSPLVPQLRDLLQEYAIAGGDRVRVEWVDPARSPELEREAHERYGIRATPFQVADRYQSSLVNAYFHLLVQYGDAYQTLGFRELVEIKPSAAGAGGGAASPPYVGLRSPEADITRAVREVLREYRSGGDVWATIDAPLELIAYVSADAALPGLLRDYRQTIAAHLDSITAAAGGKFTARFVDPTAGDGRIATQIQEQWGLTPMVSPLQGDEPFFFSLILRDREQAIALPTAAFDSKQFPEVLMAGIRRFAAGITRTVALSVPDVHPDMARFRLGGPTFNRVENALARDYSLIMEDLADGSIAPEADVLAVLAPHRLSEAAVYAIDQFLMRGGTVLIASSPYTVELADGELRRQDWPSGLEQWLSHHGIGIGDALVLDRRNAAIPAPVQRQAAGYAFRDVQMIDYPYFIDIRDEGIAREHPATESLPQVTMVWASPITVQTQPRGRRAVNLLRSSPESWLSSDPDITPRLDADGRADFQPTSALSSQPLTVVLEGRFQSAFGDREAPDRPGAVDTGVPARVIRRSPESARLIVFGSNDFLDDQMLATTASGSGERYLGALELFLNTLDWALHDADSLRIRSRSQVNRTLPPMERQSQQTLEYLNYGLAIAWLGLLVIICVIARKLRRRAYARELGL